MRKFFFALTMVLNLLLAVGTVCAEQRTPSPDWVANLPQAAGAKQLFVVAGIGKTTPWVSMHEKDEDGNWRQIMTTPGVIGKNGLGSAIFLHCFGPAKPYTGGCVALPEEKMRFVMQHVRPDCVVVINALQRLSPETAEAWGI